MAHVIRYTRDGNGCRADVNCVRSADTWRSTGHAGSALCSRAGPGNPGTGPRLMREATQAVGHILLPAASPPCRRRRRPCAAEMQCSVGGGCSDVVPAAPIAKLPLACRPSGHRRPAIGPPTGFAPTVMRVSLLRSVHRGRLHQNQQDAAHEMRTNSTRSLHRRGRYRT